MATGTLRDLLKQIYESHTLVSCSVQHESAAWNHNQQKIGLRFDITLLRVFFKPGFLEIRAFTAKIASLSKVCNEIFATIPLSVS